MQFIKINDHLINQEIIAYLVVKGSTLVVATTENHNWLEFDYNNNSDAVDALDDITDLSNV